MEPIQQFLQIEWVQSALTVLSLLIVAISGLIALAEGIAALTKNKDDDAAVKRFADAFRAIVGKLQMLSLYKPK